MTLDEAEPRKGSPGRPGRGQPNKISPEQWEEIVERYKCGDSQRELAHDFCVTTATIGRQLKERMISAAARDIGAGKVRDTNLKKFLAEARKTIWHADDGLEKHHFQYFAWKDDVNALKAKHKMPYASAAIAASKEHKVLWPLFRKYNVKKFDKFPRSHPMVTRYEEQEYNEVGEMIVKNEGIKQDHRANLDWAITAAGEYARTKIPPVSCPNDAAFFMFEQAKGEPDKFLARFTTVISKSDDALGRDERIESNRSIEEIDRMLSVLTEPAEEEEESDEGD